MDKALIISVIVLVIGVMLYFMFFAEVNDSVIEEKLDKEDLSKEESKTSHQKGKELEFKALNYYVSNGYNVIDCAKDFPKADLMGVDLIAEKGNQILFIQCKNHKKINDGAVYKALYKLLNFYDLHHRNKVNKLVEGRVVLSKENGKLPANIYNIFASRQDGSAYRKEFPIRYEMI